MKSKLRLRLYCKLMHYPKKHSISSCNIFRSYICIALAQIGLGSPDLYTSIPFYLQQQMLSLMLDFLETGTPAEIRRYEEEMGSAWDTFLPYVQFLYTPATSNMSNADSNLHIHCCNVLLHGLENTLGRDSFIWRFCSRKDYWTTPCAYQQSCL